MGRRILIYLFGLAISALGIALIIHSAAGAGPWDTVAVGLKNHFGLTIGIWSVITQGVFMVITAALEKEKLQLGSIVAVIIRSLFLDVWFYIILTDIDFTNSLVVQWMTLFTGVIAVGIGIGLYVEARLPKTPVDGLMIALCNKFGWGIVQSRLVIELSGVTLGYLLGGPVGLGTVIIALILGKIIQFSNRIIKVLLTAMEKESVSSSM